MKYIVLHREEKSGSKEWEKDIVTGANPEFAVRNALNERQIKTREFEVHRIGNTWTSDQFTTDGVFDDLYDE